MESVYWRQVYDMKPATVTVTRRDPADFQQRQLVVYLDGQRLGEILFGESLTHEIPMMIIMGVGPLYVTLRRVQ